MTSKYIKMMDNDKRQIYRVSSGYVKKMKVNVLSIVSADIFFFVIMEARMGRVDIGNIIYSALMGLGAAMSFNTIGERLQLTEDYLERSVGKIKEKVEFKDVEKLVNIW